MAEAFLSIGEAVKVDFAASGRLRHRDRQRDHLKSYITRQPIETFVRIEQILDRCLSCLALTPIEVGYLHEGAAVDVNALAELAVENDPRVIASGKAL